MGAVYKARQTSLDRLVAIKVLPPISEDYNHFQFEKRFMKEAKAMAQMQHPRIVSIYEFGESAPEADSDTQSLRYIVMEYVDGISLSEIIRLGTLDEKETLAVVTQVCDALDYAHSRGVTHRDVKPANILLNTNGQVKVADFGLAQYDDPNSRGLTVANLAMGTPDYTAPEAIDGNVDHRADIFALGIILYEALCGTPPRGVFKPLSEKAETDPRLDSIVAKAIQQEPEDRYETVTQFWSALNNVLTTPLKRSRKLNLQPVPRLPKQRSTTPLPATRPHQGRVTHPVPASSGSSTALFWISGSLAIAGCLLLLFFVVGITNGSPETTSTSLFDVPKAEETSSDRSHEQAASPERTSDNPNLIENQNPFVANNTKKPKPTGFSKEPRFKKTSARHQTTEKIQPTVPVKHKTSSTTPREKPSELVTLLGNYRTLYQNTIGIPAKQNVSSLRDNYISALNWERSQEQEAGNLSSVAALNEELTLVQKAQSHLLPKLPANSSDELERLRDIYQVELSKLYNNYTKSVNKLTTQLLEELQHIESNLTKQKRIKDAINVRQHREEIRQNDIFGTLEIAPPQQLIRTDVDPFDISDAWENSSRVARN